MSRRSCGTRGIIWGTRKSICGRASSEWVIADGGSAHRRGLRPRKMIKAVRGTRDLLPPETELWNFVEAKVREVMRAYNFQEIRPPIFEKTELFARGVGEERSEERRV